MSATQQPPKARPSASAGEQAARPAVVRHATWALAFYRSALGKKYVMAVTGVIGMVYIVAHLIGNLKVYFGADAINSYGEWLRRSLGYPVLPATWTLWGIRIVLIVALVLHVHAAYALTRINRRARPISYQSKRDYIAADFAARTMRWTGVIVLLFIAYHLADFTWGWVNPEFVRGDVYGNFLTSFSVPIVSAFYIVANLALGLHLYHGAWSLFQSLGINQPRFNHWRRWFAIGFAAVVVVGYLSFPIAVLTGVVS